MYTRRQTRRNLGCSFSVDQLSHLEAFPVAGFAVLTCPCPSIEMFMGFGFSTVARLKRRVQVLLFEHTETAHLRSELNNFNGLTAGCRRVFGVCDAPLPAVDSQHHRGPDNQKYNSLRFRCFSMVTRIYPETLF